MKRECKICGKYTNHEQSAIHAQCKQCGKTGYWLTIDILKDQWFQNLWNETTQWKLENENGLTDDERQELLVWRLRMERDHVDDILEKVIKQNEVLARDLGQLNEKIKATIIKWSPKRLPH